MKRWVLITVLTIAVIGLGVWGYKVNQDKNAILVQAENNYQRAFHELTYHIDLLNEKIGATLAMNSRDQLSPQLVDIWKLTSEANSDVGQLPLTLMPFNKTEEFLYDIGNFAYRTAVRDLENKPLSEEELKRLEELHKQSGEIKNELRNVQNLVLRDNLRWMDVQLALATNDQTGDNTIVNGFKTVEKTVAGYEDSTSETDLGMGSPSMKFEFLTGEKISESEAKAIASDWFGGVDPKSLTLTKSGKGADTPIYTASFVKGEQNGYIDLTEKGGHPLTIMVARPVKNQKISLHDAVKHAETYVEKLKIENLELIESSQYGNVGVFRFVYTENDIRFYPDSLVVKVALDNGDILGLTTREFFNSHKEREINPPVLTDEEARRKVNPNLEIRQANLAVIKNDLNEQVLCYEFLTTMEDTTYRIFINATNGHEERVDALNEKEMKFDTDL